MQHDIPPIKHKSACSHRIRRPTSIIIHHPAHWDGDDLCWLVEGQLSNISHRLSFMGTITAEAKLQIIQEIKRHGRLTLKSKVDDEEE